MQKKKTHAKILDPLKGPHKNIFDPRKSYDPSKSILTHVTHSTDMKIWPTHPRNPRYYATHTI